LTMVRELDVPSLQMPHFFARLAWARAALGDRDGASRALDEAIARAAPVDRKMFEERRVLLQVEADLNAGETRRAADGLATVLAERRARDDLVFLPSRPDLAARLANLALARDIEPAYVCKLIARHGLVAPDDACTQWPFRLRVRVLGAFELVRDGEPVRFTGKTQQRHHKFESRRDNEESSRPGFQQQFAGRVRKLRRKGGRRSSAAGQRPLRNSWRVHCLGSDDNRRPSRRLSRWRPARR